MKQRLFFLAIIAITLSSFRAINFSNAASQEERFDMEKDLLLMQFDCKTDVDDLHSAAGLVTLMADPDFSQVNYHAVAGTYGIQEGLYVPPNDLFQLAFKNNWTDAHKDFKSAVKKVTKIARKTLKKGGDIWIAEAGQSDFSAALIKNIRVKLPDIDVATRIHIVQHADWNEEVTSPDDLAYVQEHIDYNKIPDGNAVGNGTPGFRTPSYTLWKQEVADEHLLEVWQLAVDLGMTYNGSEGRYNNEAVASGGVDFSDLSEVCWILGLEDIKDSEEFFDRYGGK